MLSLCQTVQGGWEQQNPAWCFTLLTQLQVIQEFSSPLEEFTLLPAFKTFACTGCNFIS